MSDGMHNCVETLATFRRRRVAVHVCSGVSKFMPQHCL